MGPLDPAPPPGTATRVKAGSPPNKPGKRRARPFQLGTELTIHGFLLEEGRHGQGPHPGSPARPNPARELERTRRDMTDPRKVRDGGADGQLKRAGSAVRTRGERVSAKPAAAELPGAQVTAN